MIFLRTVLLLLAGHLMLLTGLLWVLRLQPADSSWIAFVSYRDGDGEIYRMRPDGRQQQRLTFQRGDDNAPGWLDSQTIFFIGGMQAVYTMQLDGSEMQPYARRNLHRGSTIAPDGVSRLMLLDDGGGNWNIYLTRRGSPTRLRLTDNPYVDGFPAWSANGEWIAYAAENAQGEWDIYRMRADGSDRQRLTSTLGQDWQPAWSPGVELALRPFRLAFGGMFIGLLSLFLWQRSIFRS